MQLEGEDFKWKHKAKQHWLQQGVQNTRFFHLHATQRRKTNRIDQVRDQHGLLHHEQEQVGALFSSFYTIVFILQSNQH